MKKRINFIAFVLCFFAIIFCISPTLALPINLSNNARASLITCGPGEDLYSIFGHTAIRINDPVTGVDRVYNYGTFDFDTPNFYLKFAQGKLRYMLSVSTMQDFMVEYQIEGRYVKEQYLDLDRNQIQDLYNKLESNALPQNKYYLYDFFYDNCSTRPRDMLENIHGIKIHWGHTHTPVKSTFRDMIGEYLHNMPWAKFGIDLALGLPTDKIPSERERMFLPEKLFRAAAGADIIENGLGAPLVQKEVPVLAQRYVSGPLSFFTPSHLAWILFTLVALFTFFGKFGKGIWLDRILFSAVGLLGIAIALLWFATDHQATKWNLNLLWALPTHLVFVWLRQNKTKTWYFLLTAMLGLAMLIFWPAIPQQFNSAVAPLILTLALRSWTIFRRGKALGLISFNWSKA